MDGGSSLNTSHRRHLVFAVVCKMSSTEWGNASASVLHVLLPTLVRTISVAERRAWRVRLYISARSGAVGDTSRFVDQLRRAAQPWKWLRVAQAVPDNNAAERVFSDGASYLHRTLCGASYERIGWLSAAVRALRRLRPPNVGVASYSAPASHGGRVHALSVVHRTHLRIFRSYYPSQLSLSGAGERWMIASYSAAAGRVVRLTRSHSWRVRIRFAGVGAGLQPLNTTSDVLMAPLVLCANHAISNYVTSRPGLPTSCSSVYEQHFGKATRGVYRKQPTESTSVPCHACDTGDASGVQRGGVDEEVGEAVIVEMRPLIRLPEVLLNFIEHLPISWCIHLVHGPDNHVRVQRSQPLQQHLLSTRLRLQPLDVVAPGLYRHAMAARDLATRGGSPHDRARHLRYSRWYDDLLASPRFWRHFTAPLVLLFQIDSALCPAPLRRLSDFSENYVFVGAPWRRYSLWLCREHRSFHCVGNGGLSLWRREVLLDRVSDPAFMREWGAKDHLDVFLAAHLQRASLLELHGFEANPTDSEAALFSIETHYLGGYTPIGVHQPQSHIPPQYLAEIIRRCPAAHDLLNVTRFDPALEVST